MPYEVSPCQAAQTALHAALQKTRPDATFTDRVVGTRARYLEDYHRNLISTVPWETIEPDFGEGAGQELAGDIFAPWSSAALVANNFGAWAEDCDRLVIAGHSGFQSGLRFERRFPTGLPGTAPHLDLLALAEDGIIAIESKCLEGLCSPKRPHFQASYTTGITDGRASSRWGQLIRANLSMYRRLDVGQLVRHALGLMTSGARKRAGEYLGVGPVDDDTPITLLYAYFEPNNAAHPAWVELRDELVRLADAVADDSHVRFEYVSYPQLWQQWTELVDPPAWLTTHLDELRSRYAITVQV